MQVRYGPTRVQNWPAPRAFKKIGRRCRKLRKDSSLSQLDMVRQFEFSLSHYQKIERGDLDPSLSTLVRLAKAYGVSVSELLKGI